MEDRSKRFKRLAEYRTNEIIEKLRILGNCANKSTYSYTEEDIRKIFSAIDEQTKAVKAKFKNPKKGKEFKL